MRVYGWVLTGSYLLGRVLILILSPGAQSFEDSPGYRALADASSWSTVSFTGHQSRLWAVPVFYALLPSDPWRAVAQWAIATLAWGGLAWVLWQHHRAFAARAFAATSVAVLAVLAQVSQWDFAILSESLSISLGVAALALYLRWRDSGKNATLIALTAVSIWWAFTRFEIAVLLAFIIAAIAWTAWRATTKRLPAIVAITVMTATMAWAVSVNTAVEHHTHMGFSGGGPTEELAVYRLGWQIYADPQLAQVYRDELGMPDCPGLAHTPWVQPQVLAEYQNCPQLRQWAKDNSNTLLIKLAIASPRDFLRTTVPLLSQVYYGHSDFISHPVILPGLDWLIFPPDELSLEFSALALALLIIAGFFLSRTATMLAIASIVSTAALLAVSVSSLPRLGIQETLLIRVGLIILAAAAIERLHRRTTRDRPNVPHARQPADPMPAQQHADSAIVA